MNELILRLKAAVTILNMRMDLNENLSFKGMRDIAADIQEAIEALERVERIAGDYIPNNASEVGIALDEMRGALQDLLQERQEEKR